MIGLPSNWKIPRQKKTTILKSTVTQGGNLSTVTQGGNLSTVTQGGNLKKGVRITAHAPQKKLKTLT